MKKNGQTSLAFCPSYLYTLIFFSDFVYNKSDWSDYSCDAAFTSTLSKYRIGVSLIMKNCM